MTEPWVDNPVEPNPNAPDADRERIPNLAELWERGLLEEALDPNRQLIPSGMGSTFDKILGGGFQPGNLLGFVSAGAGMGKTAFLHQLADAWATDSAEALVKGGKVRPVVFVSEMLARDLTIRSLARLSVRPGWLLRNPSGGGFLGGSTLPRGVEALQDARAYAERFKPAAAFLTVVDRRTKLEGVDHLGRICETVREEWTRKGAEVETVLLLVDPIHRILDTRYQDETPALGDAVGQLLDITHRNKLVTAFTSDTTKSAAGGGLREGKADNGNSLEQEAELAFRGSYQLLHLPDYALALRVYPEGQYGEDVKAERDTSDEWATRYAEIITPKLRWGEVGSRPGFWYDRALFRFRPARRDGSVE